DVEMGIRSLPSAELGSFFTMYE
ncbi:hypothetical protein Pmar_PMAR017360, partial [Perkinsus marinus ATCC 50983]